MLPPGQIFNVDKSSSDRFNLRHRNPSSLASFHKRHFLGKSGNSSSYKILSVTRRGRKHWIFALVFLPVTSHASNMNFEPVRLILRFSSPFCTNKNCRVIIIKCRSVKWLYENLKNLIRRGWKIHVGNFEIHSRCLMVLWFLLVPFPASLLYKIYVAAFRKKFFHWISVILISSRVKHKIHVRSSTLEFNS